jgi:cytochrome d ubiquinol oxidase subunit I
VRDQRPGRAGPDDLSATPIGDEIVHVDVLNVARWQFGITTVYHFLMVPLTVGLAILVAGMQTAWVRTGKPRYLTMTRFWGNLLLINFAAGVVTGIVQEFQFGMSWSAYSRFVGDVFGAPLAMEGWIFTEMGRQPFVVAPNPSGVDGVWLFTARGVSGLSLARCSPR